MTELRGDVWCKVITVVCGFLALSVGNASPGWSDDSKDGKPGSPDIRLGDPIRLSQASSLRGPDIVDLDGDGKLDLVSGSYEGRIFFARQAGTPKSLDFRSEVALRTADEDVKLSHW